MAGWPTRPPVKEGIRSIRSTPSRRQSSVQQSSSSSYSQQQQHSGQQSWQQASGSFNARQVKMLCKIYFLLTSLSNQGGRLLSLATDGRGFDPAEHSLLQRRLQPLPEHDRRQLQGSPAGGDLQGRPGLEHRASEDLGGVFDPARGGGWDRAESLCSRFPAALLSSQQGLHGDVAIQVRATELFGPQAFPSGDLMDKNLWTIL